MQPDLRLWLEQHEGKDLLQVNDLDWDLELNCFTHSHRDIDGQAPPLLFDLIKGYPKGFRVLTRTLDSKKQVAEALGLNTELGNLDLLKATNEKFKNLKKDMVNLPPLEVATGHVLENVDAGNEVDILKFPAPKWNTFDGGRYIGTADAVITKDPDTGDINIGTYRVMVHDRNTVGLHISPGKHGRMIYEKYHEQGKACPMAICVGHHPSIHAAARLPIPYGMELNFVGALMGEPVAVIHEELTGLPIPANTDIVLVGWCPPGVTREEGPFCEWTGHYADTGMRPIVQVERVYYRDDPILFGMGLLRAYFNRLMDSAAIYDGLVEGGVTDVRGVWISDAALQLFTVISIKQRYAGHAKRAALLAANSALSAYFGRFVVVVDEDIDPTDMDKVLWAMCFRTDPAEDIDIIRRMWGTGLDPRIERPVKGWHSSRAIIDACKPFEWKEKFPRSIEINPGVLEKLKKRWPDLCFTGSETIK